MAFKDYAYALLRGGLPEVLDTGRPGSAQGDNRPETTAPAGTIRDRESFAQAAGGVGGAVAQYMPLVILGTVVIVGGALALRAFRGR